MTLPHLQVVCALLLASAGVWWLGTPEKRQPNSFHMALRVIAIISWLILGVMLLMHAAG